MSAFWSPHLTGAMGAHGVCLHTSLHPHTSSSCPCLVDLHAKLNWRAAALKFHLVPPFTDSDLHCEAFSGVSFFHRLGILLQVWYSAVTCSLPKRPYMAC